MLAFRWWIAARFVRSICRCQHKRIDLAGLASRQTRLSNCFLRRRPSFGRFQKAEQCLVRGEPGASGEIVPVARDVSRDPALTGSELIQLARARLPPHMVPAKIHFV